MISDYCGLGKEEIGGIEGKGGIGRIIFPSLSTISDFRLIVHRGLGKGVIGGIEGKGGIGGIIFPSLSIISDFLIVHG